MQFGQGKSTESQPKEETKEFTLETYLKLINHPLEGIKDNMRKIQGTNLYLERSLAWSKNTAVLDQVLALLDGRRWTVYRAIPRFHPNWEQASKGVAKPLGEGAASFDTGSAAWTAWQDDKDAAVGMAVSLTGMGKDDRIESVKDYSKDDDEFTVGVVLQAVVTKDTEMCFFNAGEVQVKGEVTSTVYKEIKMGSQLKDIPSLAHYENVEDGKTKVSHLMPDKEKD